MHRAPHSYPGPGSTLGTLTPILDQVQRLALLTPNSSPPIALGDTNFNPCGALGATEGRNDYDDDDKEYNDDDDDDNPFLVS